jgi:hypothetical protein
VRRAALALLAALALSAHAQAQPQPPCDGAGSAAPPVTPGAEPIVQTWSDAGWKPPDCLGWPEGRYRMLVAVAGSFRHEHDAAALLARFGAVSKKKGLRYQSVRDQAVRVLVKDAAALSAPKAGERRADFAAAEMKPGVELFYEETDNRSAAPVVYRMRVLEAQEARIVVQTENLSPVRAMMVTVFPPGSLRTAYFLERRDAGVWSIYGLSATGEAASSLAAGSAQSYINRAIALYRHYTGQPQ